MAWAVGMIEVEAAGGAETRQAQTAVPLRGLPGSDQITLLGRLGSGIAHCTCRTGSCYLRSLDYERRALANRGGPPDYYRGIMQYC